MYICTHTHTYMYIHIYISIYIYIYLSIYIYIYRSVCRPVCLSVCLPVCLPVSLCVCIHISRQPPTYRIVCIHTKAQMIAECDSEISAPPPSCLSLSQSLVRLLPNKPERALKVGG